MGKSAGITRKDAKELIKIFAMYNRITDGNKYCRIDLPYIKKLSIVGSNIGDIIDSMDAENAELIRERFIIGGGIKTRLLALKLNTNHLELTKRIGLALDEFCDKYDSQNQSEK